MVCYHWKALLPVIQNGDEMDTRNAVTLAPTTVDSDIRMVGAWLRTKQSDQTRRVDARYVLGTQPNKRLGTNGFIGLLQDAGLGLQGLGVDDVNKYVDHLESGPATLALATNVFKSLSTFYAHYD